MAVNTTPAAAAENPAVARRDCMGFIGFLLDAIFDALQQAIDGALVGMAGSETPVETTVETTVETPEMARGTPERVMALLAEHPTCTLAEATMQNNGVRILR